MTTAETLKFILLAFGAGIVLPLAVQLFLTLRSLHRTVESTSRRINETLETLEVAAKRAQNAASPTTRTLTSLGASLIPAVVAAVRAYRGDDLPTEEMAEDMGDFGPDAAPTATETGNAKDAGPAVPTKQTSHAHA